MTETEWNECSDINKMLKFVNGDRKKRLFGCACVRQIWHLLEDDRSKQAVIVAEQYADGLVSKKKLDENRKAALHAFAATYATYSSTAVYWSIYHVAGFAAYYAPYYAAAAAKIPVTTYIPLLKDIFDTFNKYKQPHCNNYTKEFARTIYDNPNEKGELLDLHILADMLIDQCVDQALVDHLRNGVHFRGCQVIDLILEKQ